MRVFEVGILYTRKIRELHLQAGVPLRESKGMLGSRFYIHPRDPGAQALITTLDYWVEELAMLQAKEEAREAAAERKRLERRRNHWFLRLFKG